MRNKRDWLIVIILVVFSLLLLFFRMDLYGIKYLTFSDAAKFADIARNFLVAGKYAGTFSFWSSGIIDLSQRAAFPSPWVPPLMPFSIAMFFKLFGISDLSVIATSSIYHILLVIFVFLLGKKLFGRLVGALSAVAVAASTDFVNYATTGSSESLFSLEIVTAFYLITLRKKWATAISVLVAILMYLTRPQAFIYIAGMVLFYLLLNFKPKKALITFTAVLVLGFIVDYFVMPTFAGKHFLYSVTGRGIGTATQVTAGGSASASLRGLADVAVTNPIVTVAKKVFYNLYNFYKLLPQIINPYLAAFFALGLFKKAKGKEEYSFKVSTLFVTMLTFLVAAASIPFFRYIHPVVPLLYILAIEMLVWILAMAIKNKKQLVTLSTLLVFLLIVGQTLGVIFLDSRFGKSINNYGKPPAYFQLSDILKENTKDTDVVITNLDTWGSWYGNRATIWYPVKPSFVFAEGSKETANAIFLTSYLINDQNYLMDEDWRLIFDNPENPAKWTCDGCNTISQLYKLKAVYNLPASENYQNLDLKAVLLIKK